MVKAIGVFTGAILFFSIANAAPITIINSGFEDLYQGNDVPVGSFPVGDAPNGWSRYDLNGVPVGGSLLGVLNPGTQADYDADGGGALPCFPAGAPEGDNVALLFKSGGASADEYGIEQQLVDTLQANTEYTLTVEVGNIQTCAGLPSGSTPTFNLDGFPGYRIELRAGTQSLVIDNNTLSINEGEFETSTITFNSPPVVLPNQLLSIRLVSLNMVAAGGNLEVDFDNVRLSTVETLAVPLPGMTYWMLAIVGAVIIRRVIRLRV